MTLEILLVNTFSTQLPDGFAEGLQTLGCHLRSVGWGNETVSALRSASPDIVVVRHNGQSNEIGGYLNALRHIAANDDIVVAQHGAFGAEVRPLSQRPRLKLAAGDLDNYLQFYARVFEHLTVAAPRLVETPLHAGQMILESHDHRVVAGQDSVQLRGKEFALLDHLARRPDRWFSRAQLINAVWHGEHDVDERTVDVSILRLRRALTPLGAAGVIVTQRNKGYGFCTNVHLIRPQSLPQTKATPRRPAIRTIWSRPEPTTAC